MAAKELQDYALNLAAYSDTRKPKKTSKPAEVVQLPVNKKGGRQ